MDEERIVTIDDEASDGHEDDFNANHVKVEPGITYDMEQGSIHKPCGDWCAKSGQKLVLEMLKKGWNVVKK